MLANKRMAHLIGRHSLLTPAAAKASQELSDPTPDRPQELVPPYSPLEDNTT